MPRTLWLALAVLGVVLTATVIPGVFSIDEDNYLVTVLGLRQGELTVPGTAGLPPSSELVWFDPTARSRVVDSTPVSSTAPPLYAPLALPFLAFGWRGLVAVNTLAFLVTAALVFVYCRRHSAPAAAPWVALAAFVLGAYNVEYAQGLWPHMTSVALTTGCVVLASAARERGSLLPAVAAGLLGGLATGIRYQNFAFAGCVGLGILLLSQRRRFALGAAYAGGIALPLALSSWINQARLGSWNPISKGGRYLASHVADSGEAGAPYAVEVLRMLWARVADFSARPTLAGTYDSYLRPDPDSGAYVLAGAVKKALLQSAPWAVLPLAVLVLVWVTRRPSDHDAARTPRTELRSMSLIVWPMLFLFAAFGSGRTDGFCFNQRYLLELVPLLAVAFGWSLAGVARSRDGWTAGGALGLLLVAAVLVRPADSPIRQTALLYLPLALAALLAVAALPTVRARRATLLTGAAALSLAWGAGVHLGDDLVASRAVRQHHLAVARTLDGWIPAGSALFAWWGNKDAAGPLVLEDGLVVADAWADDGRTMPALFDAFAARDRRVFVLANGFPPEVLDQALGGRPIRTMREGPLLLIEVGRGAARPAAAPAADE